MKNSVRRISAILAALIAAAFMNAASATPFQITINTSALSGLASQLAFDFIDGGSPSNTITVTGFSTNGTLGAAATSGGVSGSIPGTLSLFDSSFFNEYLRNITLGTFISFIFNDTGLGAGGTPDGFSMFLLDPLSGLPLVHTSDPTGSDALFLLNVGSPLGLQVYTSNQISYSIRPLASTVPEPGTLLLLAAGAGFALRRRSVLPRPA